MTYNVDIISFLLGVISGAILIFALVALVRVTGHD